VLAHELGHVKNRDILTSSIAATLAGAITMWRAWATGLALRRLWGPRRPQSRRRAWWPVHDHLAPIAASLIQLAISRSREFEADATGAKETGNPMPWRGRSRSLMRTRGASRCRPRPPRHICSSWHAAGQRRHRHLFSTHPPISNGFGG